MAALLTLQPNHRLVQTTQDIELPRLADLLDLVVEVFALATPMDLVQYLRSQVLSI